MEHETTVTQKPLVSVVIEGYNESRSLGTAVETLEALQRQDFPLDQVEAKVPSKLSPDQTFVVLCAHGFRSLEATLILRKKGFKNGRSLEGGLAYWRELGY